MNPERCRAEEMGALHMIWTPTERWSSSGTGHENQDIFRFKWVCLRLQMLIKKIGSHPLASRIFYGNPLLQLLNPHSVFSEVDPADSPGVSA